MIVIEGKRTEPHPTIRTEWMTVRHQMLRHLDAAWEARAGRVVYGLLIVEGQSDAPTIVPAKWRRYASQVVAPTAIAGSLPHRSEEECLAIASTFLGATTWQAVCAQFGIDWASIPHGAPPCDRP